jgi:Domain of unknown function (DUF5666)
MTVSMRIVLSQMVFTVFLVAPLAVWAQTQAPSSQENVPLSGQLGPGREGKEDQRGPGLIGKITSLENGAIQIMKPDGETVTVKYTSKTELRRGKEVAKLSDFKVGAGVLVRGEENADHSWTARMIALPPKEGSGNGGIVGEMGKDYVVGEVKSIDAPKLTILRTDKVTQTIELTEESSLRRGQDSVTMADLQPGDHVFVRGETHGHVFLPKLLFVIEPEQWKRMQEMGLTRPSPTGGKPKTSQTPPEHNR